MNCRDTRKPTILDSQARRVRRLLGVAAMLAGLLLALKAQAQAPDEGLLLRGPQGEWTAAVALESSIDIQVRGLLVETLVTQRFINDSEQWIEGRYLLPLPEDAAVDSLRLRVGQRLIEGEIQEKAKAQATYQRAAASGQRAALVEASRPNLFRTQVANIGPGETVQIEIGYRHVARYADGAFGFSLPLTFVPRYPGSGTQDIAEAQPAARTASSEKTALPPTLTIRVRLDAGMPLASVASTTHPVTARDKGGQWLVELTDQVILPEHDFELRWTPEPSSMPRSALFTEKVDGEFFALIMLMPPTQAVAPLPRELILVIDNSGSMHGTPMAQAIAALDQALAALRPGDRFNVVRFNHTADKLFPEAVAALPPEVETARRFVRGLSAEGGTEIGGALSLSLAGVAPPGFVRQVVLATDAGIGNEQALFAQIERELGQSRLFPLGIGSAPNSHFLRKAAELGRGSSVVIRDLSDVQTGMQQLFARLDRPAMTGLKLDWPVFAEGYPERLPDLYADEPLQVVARLPQLAGDVKLSGSRGARAWQEFLPLKVGGTSSNGVAKLWARARLEALDDGLRAGADAELTRLESLQVALRFGLVSRYTSLVAVERSIARPSDAALESVRVANAEPAQRIALAQGSTAARSLFGFAMLLALLAIAMRPARGG
jgi:Ca-activated chloride channel family protein